MTTSNITDSGASTLYQFSFNKNPYDQSTYFGRFMHFQRVVDPRNFFASQS